MEQIVEYRSYAGAKRVYDAADTAEAKRRLPADEVFGLIQEIEFEIAQEEIEKANEPDRY